MIEVKKDKGIEYAYSNDLGMAVMAIGNKGVLVTNNNIPTVVTQKKEGAKAWAPWGKDDKHPQNVIKDLKASTIIPSKLDEKARFLYAGGITYGYMDIVDGKRKFIEFYDVEIEKWLVATGFERYLMESSKDLYWFNHVFAEVVLDDSKKVIRVATQAAENCRFEWMNEATGRVDFVYVNKNRSGSVKDEDTEVIACLDAYDNPAAYILADNRPIRNYILPVSLPSPGCEYYQIPEWDSVRESKWLDYSKAIPEFKMKLMLQQLNIEWHIEIADWYWTWKYPDFLKVDLAKRNSYIAETRDDINKHLTGLEAAGKGLFTTFMTDKTKMAELPGVKISRIDNKLKDGQYLDDGKMANEHLLYALSFDPSLAGQTPGSQGGSGSDKRIAYNIYISLIKPHQDLIVSVMNLVSELNGWHTKVPVKDRLLIWRFNQATIETQNTGTQMKPVTAGGANG